LADSHLILVRHATAEERSRTGRDEDRVLTSLGNEQAERLAAAAALLGVPNASAIYTSGYARAVQTRKNFSWLTGPEVHDSVFCPWGNPQDAAAYIRSQLQPGDNTVWVFSHNPFLSGFIAAFGPRVFEVVGKFRKADLVWLRWRSRDAFLHQQPDLKGFLSKPRQSES